MCRAQAAETRRVARRILRSLIRTFKFKSRLRRAFSKLLFSVPALPPDARGPASGSRRPSRCSSPAPFPVTSAARAPEPLPRLVLRRRLTGPSLSALRSCSRCRPDASASPAAVGSAPSPSAPSLPPVAPGAACRTPRASVCLAAFGFQGSGRGRSLLCALRCLRRPEQCSRHEPSTRCVSGEDEVPKPKR